MLSLARPFLRLSPAEVTFAKRRFHDPGPELRLRLEGVGEAFRAGYHAALDQDEPAPLGRVLDEMPAALRGFAYEGAGMALALQDALSLRRRDRVERFLAGPGEPHTYLVVVGAGWILARLPVRVAPLLARFDPLVRWLALDGYGFHEGYFHWPRTVVGQRRPAKLYGYARHGFDQGLGRSLWFVCGGEVDRIAETIRRFAPPRQADLWAGVGLACAYAGGRSAEEMRRLRDQAAEHDLALAQGVVFAATARERAGNPTPHTELACRVLTGVSAAAAAAITEEARVGLPPDAQEPDGVPAYEIWRRRICQRLEDMEQKVAS